MASKKLITFYKSQVVEPVMIRLNELTLDEFKKLISLNERFRLFCRRRLSVTFTKESTDSCLKEMFGYEFSTTKMTTEELQELIVWSFQFADSIGLELDYLPDALDNEIDLNI